MRLAIVLYVLFATALGRADEESCRLELEAAVRRAAEGEHSTHGGYNEQDILPVAVQSAHRLLEAKILVSDYDLELRPANLATHSKDMGCDGILTCPSDAAVLTVARKAQHPDTATIARGQRQDFLRWLGVPVLYRGVIVKTGSEARTRAQGPGITWALFRAPEGTFIGFGHAYQPNLREGDEVEVLGLLGSRLLVENQPGPQAMATLVMLRPGSTAKIKAMYPTLAR